MAKLTLIYLTQESPIQIGYFIPHWRFNIPNWDTITNWDYFPLVVYFLPQLLIRFYGPFKTTSLTNKHSKSNNKGVFGGSHLGLYGQVLWPDPTLVGLGPTRAGFVIAGLPKIIHQRSPVCYLEQFRHFISDRKSTTKSHQK